MFPTYDKKQFAKVVTGDETWVHYKIWTTKHSKCPIIAIRSSIAKKVLYAIRSRNNNASEKGQKQHRKVLQRHSTEESEKVLSETTLCHWIKHIRLLHDNAPTHTSEIDPAFLKKENVTV